jgi:hypothetical protein
VRTLRKVFVETSGCLKDLVKHQTVRGNASQLSDGFLLGVKSRANRDTGDNTLVDSHGKSVNAGVCMTNILGYPLVIRAVVSAAGLVADVLIESD